MTEPRTPHPEPRTVVEALENAAARAPDRGFTLYDRRGQRADFHSYPVLLERARAAARQLAAAGIDRGDRVLICLPTCWELLEAFLGAIVRGALPTLVAPAGNLGGAAAHAAKLTHLLELMGSKRLLCDEATRKELVDFNATPAAAASLTGPELAALPPASADCLHRPAPEELAFLQLTSGSTGKPRAVMIPHATAVANARGIGRMIDAAPFATERSVVSWLPLNHDMGLIGCIIFPLTHGVNLFLLRSETFLARPRLWLQTIAAQRDCVSPGPNFAYQLCIERIDPAELAGLDLSGWTFALTGSEMVRADTCRAFAEKFAPFGFKPEKFMPCYGLAEGTLTVTCDTQHRGVRTLPVDEQDAAGLALKDLVCAGAPILDTRVAISDPNRPGTFLAEGLIGEVWAKGPGIFAGYYRDEAVTRDTLVDGWLRTGDLGFMRGGELYLTGRLKDLLIIHGHNIAPHELEWIAEDAAGGGGTERCGAFSVARGVDGEQAVVVLETGLADSAALELLAHEVRSRIGRTLGLPLADLVLVRRGVIPKTTSGKVQRAELRRRYLAGQIERR